VERPAVQSTPPPNAVIKVVNPVIRVLLRSPLHGLADKKLLLLTVTGRKTGRTYTVPGGRHESGDGTFLISASGGWRHNLHGGADVRITLDGRDHAARATLEEDPDVAAAAFKTMLDQAGPRALAVKVNVDHSPTADEIKPALAERGVAYLQLLD
jgi:hypothetical protein